MSMALPNGMLEKATKRRSMQYHGGGYEKKNIIFQKGKKNPYIADLKKQVTIRLDAETINYFRHLSEKNGIPYQTLINLYLRDCARKHKKLSMEWLSSDTTV